MRKSALRFVTTSTAYSYSIGTWYCEVGRYCKRTYTLLATNWADDVIDAFVDLVKQPLLSWPVHCGVEQRLNSLTVINRAVTNQTAALNDEIRAKEVRLVDENGEQKGIGLADALRVDKQLSLILLRS